MLCWSWFCCSSKPYLNVLLFTAVSPHLAVHRMSAGAESGADKFMCRDETGRWQNAFQYCRGKCRTNSHSTVHENAYLASNVYCYSAMGEHRLKVEVMTSGMHVGGITGQMMAQPPLHPCSWSYLNSLVSVRSSYPKHKTQPKSV